ncbi:hypothetical protein JR316_0004997 [Psilocybe cubensis]|uniref:Uncharacterized protein n=2 Tax=Psilocybe cubensis TaxID=181762 RepID=A0ACB8H5G9_PSICU|nr:hypothetical protein JR316_0004997 [Psilocybe cubensis]KAH9482897.1 hypothetical protein JR316_0004997 [Psilocybe cubensis]
MDMLHSQAFSTTPQAVKQAQKTILQEAKSEEKYVKNILKDLSHTEKIEHKAEKEASKAEIALESSKKQEQQALKDVYRAENRRNAIVAEIVQIRDEIEVADKLESSLEELEKKEQAALKDVYRAENKYHVTIANVEQARQDYEISSRNYDATRTALHRKTSYADDVLAKHDENTDSRTNFTC